MSTVWSGGRGNAKAVCSTGSEAAPVAATDGLSLEGLGGFAVHVEAESAIGGGTLQAYLFNQESGNWNRASADLDLVVTTGLLRQGFAGFRVPSPAGRIAYVPSGLNVAVAVYLNGTRAI